MKSIVFAKRNLKEISRDPLSYVFCLILPVLLLIVFQVINHFSPEAVWFKIDFLTPGICVFSFTFVMLYMAILVSKDRATCFLTRLYSSPMKTHDYVLGYLIPGVIIGLAQAVGCFLTAFIIGLITNINLDIFRVFLTIISFIPVIVLFVGLGILFGSLFSEKSTPGIASIIISASGFLSGAWMPLNTMGGFETFCLFLPFYPAVSCGRVILMGTPLTFDNFFLPFITVLIYTLIIFSLSIFAFKNKMSSDKK